MHVKIFCVYSGPFHDDSVTSASELQTRKKYVTFFLHDDNVSIKMKKLYWLLIWASRGKVSTTLPTITSSS